MCFIVFQLEYFYNFATNLTVMWIFDFLFHTDFCNILPVKWNRLTEVIPCFLVFFDRTGVRATMCYFCWYSSLGQVLGSWHIVQNGLLLVIFRTRCAKGYFWWYLWFRTRRAITVLLCLWIKISFQLQILHPCLTHYVHCQ